jgi:hypothetical protein
MNFSDPMIQQLFLYPKKLPKNAILRHESALSLLDRVKWFSKTGLRMATKEETILITFLQPFRLKRTSGTLSVIGCGKTEIHYNGLSVLPYSGGSYKQAPFEDCDELTYKRMMDSLARY